MTEPYDCKTPAWPGLDHDFHQAILAEGFTPDGEALRLKAQDRFMFAEGKPFLLGPPHMIRAEMAESFRRVTRLARAETMLKIERSVCGCDYGATSWTTRREALEVAEE